MNCKKVILIKLIHHFNKYYYNDQITCLANKWTIIAFPRKKKRKKDMDYALIKPIRSAYSYFLRFYASYICKQIN